MALHKIKASKDATVYSEYPLMNTGLDEILELRNLANGGMSRILIEFPLDEIYNVWSNTPQWRPRKATLNLQLAEADNIPMRYEVECNPILAPWDPGLGRYNNTPQTQKGVAWNDISLEPTNVRQIILYNDNNDLNIDVTNILDNPNGFALTLVSNLDYKTSLKYFSKETHTIYQPLLELYWDDYMEHTLLDTLTKYNLIITISNNKGIYRSRERIRFNLNIRDKFPVRSFKPTSIYLDNYKIKNITWGLLNMNTNKMVINFSSIFTKVSSDINSNYFFLNTNGLEPENYYKVLFKIENTEISQIYEGDYFKIVK